MRWIVVPALLACLAAAAPAAQRFPLPEYPSWYSLPSHTEPPPRAPAMEYVDLALLAAALAAAAYLGLRARRRWGLVVLTVLCLAYFGFYRRGCVCPIGAVQNVAQGLFAGSPVPLFVLGFFLLPLAATVLFGRVFCAGVCPLGAIQDLVLLKPLRLPRWLEGGLGMLPWAYLAAAVLLAATGGAFVICRYDPFVGIFRLSAPAHLLIFGACVLLVGVFVGRPYCRFACPYGAIMRPLAAVSWRHATITPEECINCRLCEGACPYGAILAPTPTDPPAPRAQGKALLAVLIALVPVLVLAGAGAAWQARGPLARESYAVRLADHVRRLEPLDRAERLAARPPLKADGWRYDVVRDGNQARAVAKDAASGTVVWRAVLYPHEDPAQRVDYSDFASVRAAIDGNTVWLLIKDRQAVGGVTQDLYELAVLEAATGRPLRRHVERLDASMTRAFRNAGLTPERVYQQAGAVGRRVGVGAALAGGFVGLAVGLTLLRLSVRRTRADHQIDRARCVSCGRCFAYCPIERRRREGKAHG